MNITFNEIEKLRRMLDESHKTNGSVCVSDMPVTNCPMCMGSCLGSCTQTCNHYCDGTGVMGVCWNSFVGFRR